MRLRDSEDGYILFLCMMILVVLTIIGIASMRNTSVELQVAGNDNLQKKTFYGAEAGAILSAEVLEQNINCPAGFTKTGTSGSVEVCDLEGNIRVYSRGANKLALYLNQYPWTNTDCNITDTAAPNLGLPVANIGTGVEETEVWMGGVSGILPGGSIQMAAGYEGNGQGAASGGAFKAYDIISVNQDVQNSESRVLFGWRHVVGTEGDCNY